MTKPWVLSLLAISVSALLIASCGGGGDSTTGDQGTKDEAALAALFSEWGSIDEEVGSPDPTGDFDAWSETAQSGRQRLRPLIEELEALRVGGEYQALAEALHRILTTEDSFLRLMIDALEERDPAQVRAAGLLLDDLVDHIGDYGDERRRIRGRQSDSAGDDDSSPDSSSSSVPLYSSDIRDFSKGGVRVTEAGQRELDKVIDSGQQVIVCWYGPFNLETQTEYQPWGFWYESVPDNIDELHVVARDAGGPNYVGELGRNTMEDCPESNAAAEAAWRRGR